MKSRLPVCSLIRAGFLRLPIVFGLVFLAGCDLDSYPKSLHYNIRTDPIIPDTVIKEWNKVPPTRIDLPGEFPNLLSQLSPELTKGIFYPDQLDTNIRAILQTRLDETFGTPANPAVNGVESATSDLLVLNPGILAEGSRVYRQQCLHCHGLTGDGRGPTAPWVHPHPRDYRLGRFKFTSSGQDEGSRKPRRIDILRTIREGIEGTSMPAFKQLPDNEIEAVASYVIHLSFRGELEFSLMSDLFTDAIEKNPEAINERFGEYLQLIQKNWMEAEAQAIKPSPMPAMTDAQLEASIRNGYKLFMSKTDAGCVGCHIDFGRQATFNYDAWGTINKAANLTLDSYRGGRRPIDLYFRIHSGINGSGMTAFGKLLKPEEIWDLVNFLRVLPYPQMREKYGIQID